MENMFPKFELIAIIPLDEVDDEITKKPEHWDMRFIRNFMLVMGPVSSVFNFFTFGLLLLVFHANDPVPDRLVHRVAGNPGSGHLRAAHTGQSLKEPAASSPRRHLRRCVACSSMNCSHRCVAASAGLRAAAPRAPAPLCRATLAILRLRARRTAGDQKPAYLRGG